ncbi:hypothetical protein [Natronosalvus caseinilyticus]|uniref:hypothetical protein n=1 Tax=Natronosalvus caseinilyticus TaxID=2953747 RepID=UPI0028A84E6A|nr:hypothetical protein [Natronosalvus caseinilyticus]
MFEDSTPTSNTSSKQLAVNRPSRGADRNQNLVDKADPGDENILLPSLDDGITLLDIDGGRGVPILQSLVLDHLLMHDGPAFWVDANGHATTTALAQISPSQRLLDRIHVARGFTAYQHYGAVCDLPKAVNQYVRQTTTTDAGATNSRSPGRDDEPTRYTPSLIVAPAVDAQYRADDTLGETHAATLQARTLARLATYAEGYDVPILVTRTKPDEFTASVATAAEHHLECEQTQMGPRFVGDEFETLIYPVDGGAYYQTTFAYWRQLLGARAKQVGLEPAAPPSPTDATDDIGLGVIADGSIASLTANPLLDAWTGTVGAGGR